MGTYGFTDLYIIIFTCDHYSNPEINIEKNNRICIKLNKIV